MTTMIESDVAAFDQETCELVTDMIFDLSISDVEEVEVPGDFY